VESVLRETFAQEETKAKDPEPVSWSIGDVVDAVGNTQPHEPPVCCEKGHVLKQGISKGGKPYFGYVCKGNIKEHANWAKMTSNGNFYFEGGE
jgi:hypothetical protein